jgi:hypothetical protein
MSYHTHILKASAVAPLVWVEIINTGDPTGPNTSLPDAVVLVGQTFTTIGAQTDLKVEMYGSKTGSPVCNLEMVLTPLTGADPLTHPPDYFNPIAVSNNKLDVSTFSDPLPTRLDGFIFSGLSLTAGTPYALVPRYVDIVTLDGSNRMAVGQGPNTPTYLAGINTISFDTGTNWNPNAFGRSNAYLIFDLQ